MKDKLQVFKTINFLSDYLGKKPVDIIGRLAFFDDVIFNKLKEDYNSVIKFYELPFDERAEQLGFTVSKNEKGFEISTVL